MPSAGLPCRGWTYNWKTAWAIAQLSGMFHPRSSVPTLSYTSALFFRLLPGLLLSPFHHLFFYYCQPFINVYFSGFLCFYYRPAVPFSIQGSHYIPYFLPVHEVRFQLAPCDEFTG